MQNLKHRALSAYYRSHDGNGQQQQPSAPEHVNHNGLDYIVLFNTNGILAVYRVRTIKGASMLKRLIRWPAAAVEGLV